jgi:NAD(P)-dependent dehydrogenase (short-subunit alcohol dehydrogenase family)
MASPAPLKIVVVGATGIIGSAVAAALAPMGDVSRVGRTRGDLQADAGSIESIQALFARTGRFDHLVSLVGGDIPIGNLRDLSPADMTCAFANKVLPQIQLVQLGLAHIRDGGSFTLSAGFLNKEPKPGFTAIAMANGALEGFVAGAALDMERGIRINSVSPVFIIESLERAGLVDMTSFVTMSAADTALAYVAAISGSDNGRNLDPRQFAKVGRDG